VGGNAAAIQWQAQSVLVLFGSLAAVAWRL